MKITKEQFRDYEKANNRKLNATGNDFSKMSIERWKLTSLDINTYIYIADYYEELKRKFNRQ